MTVHQVSTMWQFVRRLQCFYFLSFLNNTHTSLFLMPLPTANTVEMQFVQRHIYQVALDEQDKNGFYTLHNTLHTRVLTRPVLLFVLTVSHISVCPEAKLSA